MERNALYEFPLATASPLQLLIDHFQYCRFLRDPVGCQKLWPASFARQTMNDNRRIEVFQEIANRCDILIAVQQLDFAPFIGF